MMGEQKSEPQLFNYAVNLEKRVRVGHPLRQVKAHTPIQVCLVTRRVRTHLVNVAREKFCLKILWIV